jgi:hypothetical protein
MARVSKQGVAVIASLVVIGCCIGALVCGLSPVQPPQSAPPAGYLATFPTERAVYLAAARRQYTAASDDTLLEYGYTACQLLKTMTEVETVSALGNQVAADLVPLAKRYLCPEE